jgi:ribosomal protein S18 acetylase RimI-like enzyme
MAMAIVRNFLPEDQDGVAELYASGQDAHIDVPNVGVSYKWFVNDVLKPGGDMRNIQTTYVDKCPGKNCFLVAELDGKLVGCVAGLPGKKYGPGHLELTRMCVSSECRGMGVGGKLLRTLEFWAKEVGYTQMYLSTLSGFVTANTFYKKYGFHVEESLIVHDQADVPTPVTVNYYLKSIA